MNLRTWLVCGALGSGLLAPRAHAEGARFYNLEGFGQFLDGNPESTAITEDGTIVLPPTVRERYSDAAAAFSAATARGNDIVVARVDDGEVFAIDRAGKTRTLFRAEETLVTALLDTDRGLFVATGAPAKIYCVDSKGKVTTFHTADAGHIWALADGPGDTLFAATGEPGTVVRIDAKGNGTVIFEPEQKHLRSIVYDKTLGIFVGGGERGTLYRSADGKAFRALYGSTHTEITAIVVSKNSVYIAAVTGADALATEPEEKGKGKGPEVSSQMIAVGMDGSAEIIAGSSDEGIFAMVVDDKDQVVVATGATGRDDPRGRLYAVEPKERRISMLYQSPSRRITHLVPLPRGAMAAVAAGGGRISHLSGGYAPKGEFFTLPFDAGINAQFGNVRVFGSWPKGTAVTTALRTGQIPEPDESWSDWSQEVKATENGPLRATNGRYFQLRVSLESAGDQTPIVHRVRLAYQRQNLPPFVREVVALSKGLALFAVPYEAPKSKTISLGDKSSKDAEDDDDDKKNGKNARARQTEETGALTVRWLAEDPNGDELRYDLSFRPLGRSEWTSMKAELDDPFYTINSSRLPDGHYQFRVRATDAPSNADGRELDDTRNSPAVLVDNTAPSIDALNVTVVGKRVTARTVVADLVGPLITAEYSLDGRSFRPLVPDDGVLDGPGESFTLRLGLLETGEHILTLHVVDEADNHGAAEAHFTVH